MTCTFRGVTFFYVTNIVYQECESAYLLIERLVISSCAGCCMHGRGRGRGQSKGGRPLLLQLC